MNDTPERATLPNHEARMTAAERVAQWHLGDESWARLIVGAYLDPTNADDGNE